MVTMASGIPKAPDTAEAAAERVRRKLALLRARRACTQVDLYCDRDVHVQTERR
jgi:hypothetical protein